MSRRKKNTPEDDVAELTDVPTFEEEGRGQETSDDDEGEVSSDSESEEEEKPIKKTTSKKVQEPRSKIETIKKKTTKISTPLKTKKTKEQPQEQKKQGIYPFDSEFMRSYKTLVEMLNDRGYNLSQPGKQSLFGYSEQIVPNKDGGTKIKKIININSDTQRALTNEFGGLEHFKLELTHENPQLNVLVYFVIPGIEAKSATQARKQLPIDQVRHALRAYEESAIPRLILLSNVELATQGIDLIRKANQQTVAGQPHRYVHFFSTEELSFNWMKSRYQPKNIRVLRDEEQNAVLSSIEIDDNQEDKRHSLPYISDIDPLCMWYGAKVGDLIQLTRKLPITTEYLRYVLPFETLTT